MDKKLNRVIGYVKQPETKTVIEFKKQEISQNNKVTVTTTNTYVDNSPKIADWIKSHPKFKVASLCSDLGLDRSNFKKVVNSATPHFDYELIVKIESIIKEYGYE